jgi:hypothetical protein
MCFGGDCGLITRQATQWICVLHIRPVTHQFPYKSYLSHHSRTILSFETVRSCTYSDLSESLLKKHILKSAFLTAVTAMNQSSLGWDLM